MTQQLTQDEVRHIATLARLELSDEEITRYRDQLGSILQHVSRLDSLDLENVEPLAGPRDDLNRFAADEPQVSMPLEKLQANAPQMMDRYIAVPKVIEEE